MIFHCLIFKIIVCLFNKKKFDSLMLFYGTTPITPCVATTPTKAPANVDVAATPES